MSVDYAAFLGVVNSQMEKLGITPARLIEMSELPKPTVYRIIRGKNPPNTDNYIAICRALQIDPDTLTPSGVIKVKILKPVTHPVVFNDRPALPDNMDITRDEAYLLLDLRNPKNRYSNISQAHEMLISTMRNLKDSDEDLRDALDGVIYQLRKIREKCEKQG